MTTDTIETQCKVWPMSGRHTNGYGVKHVKVNGRFKQILAHRWAWEQKNGPIPAGLCVLHKCDNRECVNVDHLFLGTQVENLEDMTRKGRRRSGGPAGEKASNHFYTTEQVLEIRRLFSEGWKIADLQKKYGGKSYQGIWVMVHRRSWKHI